MASIYLITGPTQSRKTTTLSQWASGRSAVGGLLSPVISDKRHFQEIQSGQLVPMEAALDETQVQQVGRFTFSEAAFVWANKTLLETARQPGLQWLVVDEAGPLELQGKGLHPALEFLLAHLPPKLNLVLVIRESILERAIHFYGLRNYPLIIIPGPEQIGSLLK